MSRLAIGIVVVPLVLAALGDLVRLAWAWHRRRQPPATLIEWRRQAWATVDGDGIVPIRPSATRRIAR